MSEKQAKIHSLGPKKMSSTAKGFFTAASPNTANTFYHSKPLLPVVTAPQPQIRYLLVQHPQFDTLVKELAILRQKYDELLVKFDQKCTHESLRQNIQQVIESTHNIEAKMSRIVDDTNQLAQNSQDKENQPTLQAQNARHQKQCLQIIETVNKATQKIEELEGKNAKLQEEVSKQKEWKEALEAENKRLRLMMQNVESEKQQEIEKMREELQDIRGKKEIQLCIQKSRKLMEQARKLSQSKLEYGQEACNQAEVGPLSMKNSKKITNEQYLCEEVQNEVSGFSRLTIYGDVSRLSRVYE